MKLYQFPSDAPSNSVNRTAASLRAAMAVHVQSWATSNSAANEDLDALISHYLYDARYVE